MIGCVRSDSQVQWIEEEDQVLSLIVSEFDLFELVINDSLPFEIRSRFSDSSTMMAQDSRLAEGSHTGRRQQTRSSRLYMTWWQNKYSSYMMTTSRGKHLTLTLRRDRAGIRMKDMVSDDELLFVCLVVAA